MVAPGEDGVELAKREKIREIVYPYLTHPGHRYGLVILSNLIGIHA